MMGLTSNLTGNHVNICSPWSSLAFLTAGIERGPAHSQTHKDTFWKRNKGSCNWQWRMVWASMCIAVIKEFMVLSFLYLSFQGVKSFLGHWNCVSTQELANMWEGTSSGMWEQLISPRNKFHLNKTIFLKHSVWSYQTELSLQNGLGAIWGKLPSGLSFTPKEISPPNTTVLFGKAVLVRTSLWAKEECQCDWSLF